MAPNAPFKFHSAQAELFIPDGAGLPQALSRTRFLGIGAHQDDLEIMAYGAIEECFDHKGGLFSGVTVCDGGPQSDLRKAEQREAAKLGAYAAQFQLGLPSQKLKDVADSTAVDDLVEILKATKPQAVFTHNLADKHDTHVAVALRVIQAIRRLGTAERPASLAGCEVWRGLDWLADEDKLRMKTGLHEALERPLLEVFKSQVSLKRYDLAAPGRRAANATFFDSAVRDESPGYIFGMDLSPLIKDEKLDPSQFVSAHLKKFEADVLARMRRLGG